MWKDEYYVKCFRLAGDGLSNSEIARALKVPPATFAEWLQKKKALREGIAQAREAKGGGYKDFKAYCYEKLPRRARELWDELEEVEEKRGESVDLIKEKRERKNKLFNLIDAGSMKVKQGLFLHALVKCNFMVSRACHKMGATVPEVEQWKRSSKGFKELVEGIISFKADFFESALIDLVRSGDSAATIFANRTYNRNRGYGNEELPTERTIIHKHQISLEELPVDTKKVILETIRSKALLEDKRDIVDVEVDEED